MHQATAGEEKHVPVGDMAEDLECLCQIMKTVGRRLDRDKARVSTNFCDIQICAW